MPKYKITSLEDKGKKYAMKVTWQFKQYVLNIGGISDIPEDYAEYLQGLGYPVYEDRPDPLTGGMISTKVSETLRWNVVRVKDTEVASDVVVANQVKGKGPDRASDHRPA